MERAEPGPQRGKGTRWTWYSTAPAPHCGQVNPLLPTGLYAFRGDVSGFREILWHIGSEVSYAWYSPDGNSAAVLSIATIRENWSYPVANNGSVDPKAIKQTGRHAAEHDERTARRVDYAALCAVSGVWRDGESIATEQLSVIQEQELLGIQVPRTVHLTTAPFPGTEPPIGQWSGLFGVPWIQPLMLNVRYE